MSALRAALVALSAAVLTAACAAGQQAQTSREKPTIDATQGTVGTIKLVDVALRSPSGTSYSAGASVPMSVYIANAGTSADTLTNVTSTDFTSWQLVDTSSLTGDASTPAPSPSASGSGGAGSAGGATLPIDAGKAVGLGLSGLVGAGGTSKQTLVLEGLAKQSAPLTPGMAVKVTFTFANAGQTTLTVPVQLSTMPNEQTLPESAPPSE